MIGGWVHKRTSQSESGTGSLRSARTLTLELLSSWESKTRTRKSWNIKFSVGTDICNERACALNQKSKLNHSFVSAVDSEVDDRSSSRASAGLVAWVGSES
jgi:hypothetical protein